MGDALYDPALNKFTGTFGNFKLQYLAGDGVTWKDIVSVATNANNSAGDVITPVTTNKLRFTSTAVGPIKVREVYATEQIPVYDVGGPTKNAEVTRLLRKASRMNVIYMRRRPKRSMMRITKLRRLSTL